jgi:hypothetical protein
MDAVTCGPRVVSHAPAASPTQHAHLTLPGTPSALTTPIAFSRPLRPLRARTAIRNHRRCRCAIAAGRGAACGPAGAPARVCVRSGRRGAAPGGAAGWRRPRRRARPVAAPVAGRSGRAAAPASAYSGACGRGLDEGRQRAPPTIRSAVLCNIVLNFSLLNRNVKVYNKIYNIVHNIAPIVLFYCVILITLANIVHVVHICESFKFRLVLSNGVIIL